MLDLSLNWTTIHIKQSSVATKQWSDIQFGYQMIRKQDGERPFANRTTQIKQAV
jgi:hypothetical protein